ncbi:MAG: metal ABC transporter ATP-binding protein [Acidimicrobiia bacterium]
MTTAVSLRGVEVRFGRTRPLRSVDLEIEAGELVGIVGPSGAGKTTLLRLLLGEVAPSEGTVEISGGTSRRGKASVGYVPQLDASERTFPLTVQGAVELGAAATSAWVPWFSRAERDAARRALERLGIGDLSARGLHELSGGQFQRVLFARALVSDPQLLLLDEPTSGIDLRTRGEMLELVDELRNGGLTIVMTTHDLNWVASHLPRIVCLNQTVQADGAPIDVLRTDVLAHTFGAQMEVIQHAGRPVVVDGDALVGGAP